MIVRLPTFKELATFFYINLKLLFTLFFVFQFYFHEKKNHETFFTIAYTGNGGRLLLLKFR